MPMGDLLVQRVIQNAKRRHRPWTYCLLLHVHGYIRCTYGKLKAPAALHSPLGTLETVSGHWYIRISSIDVMCVLVMDSDESLRK